MSWEANVAGESAAHIGQGSGPGSAAERPSGGGDDDQYDDGSSFIPKAQWDGIYEGYCFKSGESGLGYYRLKPAQRAPEPPRKKAREGPVPGGLAPPTVKVGDYVLCAYYPRDIFVVKAVRLSMGQSPSFWSCELANPRLIGLYNWVGERYLVCYRPPQGELSPERLADWCTSPEGGTLADIIEPTPPPPPTTSSSSGRAQAHQPQLVSGFPPASRVDGRRPFLLDTGAPLPALSKQQGSGRCGWATAVFEGHCLQVALTPTSPQVAIRDLIAAMCGMSAALKGALDIQGSFFDRGWRPQQTFCFEQQPEGYQTPVVEWRKINGPDGLLAFCDQAFHCPSFGADGEGSHGGGGGGGGRQGKQARHIHRDRKSVV